jgi:2-polyprenyl-3-methyl-5-hydroxy-6-metoxy-1,4-benzoquinol methylase
VVASFRLPGLEFYFFSAAFVFMEPNEFIAEVYRRMALRQVNSGANTIHVPPTAARVAEVAAEYRDILPTNKNAKILDVGYGDGWFMAACLSLGYTNVCGAQFNIDKKAYIKDWGVTLYRIEKDIADLLREHPDEFDFIHMSHVIEHVPKYSLLWIVDTIYRALAVDGVLYLRTPNMEGPTALSSFYVTLSHEYGFAGANLISLLSICGFDDIRLLQPFVPSGLKQRIGALLRWPFLKFSVTKNRLFGVNEGGQFGSELIVVGRRRTFPPFFDEQYR